MTAIQRQDERTCAAVARRIERNLGASPQIARSRLRRRVANRAHVNNADWLCTIGLMPFLRDVGKLHRGMLRRSRSTANSRGGPYTEFSHLLAQSGLRQLFDRHGCTLQRAAAIVGATSRPARSGAEDPRAGCALVMPLITTAFGVKFARPNRERSGSMGRTSPQEFRQFWLNRRPRRDRVSELTSPSSRAMRRGARARR